MSTVIIDRQASLYPISLAQQSASTEQARHNIKVITDASIVLQLPVDVLAGAQQIVAYIQAVAEAYILLYTHIDGQLYTRQQLHYDVATRSYNNGISYVYMQPDALVWADATMLRLNAACLRIYQMPAKLTLMDWPLQAVADNQQSTAQTTELPSLSFASAGYNAGISYGRQTLHFTFGPGAGLGVHPVNRQIYTEQILTDDQFALVTDKSIGLLSINGYTQDVLIQGSGSLRVQTTAADQTITIHITRTDTQDDGQNT